MKIEVPIILKNVEQATHQAAALNREMAKLKGFGGGGGAGLASPPSGDLIQALGERPGSGSLAANQILLGKMVERGLAFRTRNALKEMAKYGNAASQGGAMIQPGLAGFINANLGIGAGQNRPARADYTNFWKGALPPIQKPVDWRMAGMSALSAPFSPWIAARGLNQSGLLSRFGFGGGGSGGSGGGLFGQGGYGGFMASFIALTAAIKVLKTAIESIPQAIERGAKLYQQSAMSATPASRLSRLQAVFEGIGLSPDLAGRMLLQSQFARRSGGGTSVSFADSVVRSAGGSLSTGEIQQIVNMRKEIDKLYENTKGAADSLAESSSAMQRIHMQTIEMKLQWQAMWARFAADFEIPIRSIEMSLTGLMWLFSHAAEIIFNAIPGLSTITQLAKASGKLPSGGPQDMSRIAGGSTQPMVSSNWQRLGLVFGNFPGQDYARQTAQNTKRLADHFASGKGNFSTPFITPGLQMP